MTTSTAPSTGTAVWRARPHLHCAPVDGGVYIDGARARFVLRGWERLFTVVDRCLPLLERGASENDLVAALGSEQARPVVRRLVAELDRHGMLLDPVDAVHSLPAAERVRFGDALAHVEAHAPRPYAAFAAVRAARVALVGPPEVVGPAARALERAGVGEIVLTAADAIPSGVDAVLSCAGDGAPLWPPGSTGPVVPVRLGPRAHVVGPVVRDGDTRVAEALARRVDAAAGAGHRTPVARPLGAALAGALAGHLLFELLAGLADETTAHVVHGAELAADRVAVARPGGPGAVVTLADPADEPPPAPDGSVPDVDELHAPWTGVFALSDTEDRLPSLPLIMRAADRRVTPPDRVVAWEAGAWYSTVAVALAVLRQEAVVAGRERAAGSVGAAGTTQETWLLDGALRLLAPEAWPVPAVGAAADGAADGDPERERLGRHLSALGGSNWAVRVFGLADLPWRLARVTRPGTGVVLGAAWAPDADGAVRDALSTAVARAQAAAWDGRQTVARLATQALMRADDPAVRELRLGVERHLARRGARLIGFRSPDPVLGELPLHHGPVSIESGPIESGPIKSGPIESGPDGGRS